LAAGFLGAFGQQQLFMIMVAPRLLGLRSFIVHIPHAASGGDHNRRPSIHRRISSNIARGTATSASWNTT
jgi:hypothetical protein